MLQQVENCRLRAVQEHANFVEGLQIHHRNWKEVAAHVGTKTVVQVSILFCLLVCAEALLVHDRFQDCVT